MTEERGLEAWLRRLEAMVEDLHRAILGDVRTGTPGLMEGHRDHERRISFLEHSFRGSAERTAIVERRVVDLEQAPAKAAETEIAEQHEEKRFVRREWTGGVIRALGTAIIGGLIGAGAIAWGLLRQFGAGVFRHGP